MADLEFFEAELLDDLVSGSTLNYKFDPDFNTLLLPYAPNVYRMITGELFSV